MFPGVDAKRWEDVKKKDNYSAACLALNMTLSVALLTLEFLDIAGLSQDIWGNREICG